MRNCCINSFTDNVLNTCPVRWQGINGWYPTRFVYVSRAEQVPRTLTWIRSRPSPNDKRNEQDKTFVIFFFISLPRLTVTTGDQLQGDVQHWLSPPDPSINYNFVSKARHNGTAVWFFESNMLREWKATGSFLWIHGKRTFSEPLATNLRLITTC